MSSVLRWGYNSLQWYISCILGNVSTDVQRCACFASIFALKKYSLGTGVYIRIYHFLVHVPYNLIPVVILIDLISYLIWYILVRVIMVHFPVTLLIYEGNVWSQELNYCGYLYINDLMYLWYHFTCSIFVSYCFSSK